MNLSQLSEIKSYLRKVDNSGYFVILQYCHGVVGKAVLQISIGLTCAASRQSEVCRLR